MSGVWVWIDHRQGKVATISLEALGAGRAVADELGTSLTALVLGYEVEDMADTLFGYGADEVIGCDDETLASFRVEAAGPLVAELAQEREPAVFLVGASTSGRDLAAWVARGTVTSTSDPRGQVLPAKPLPATPFTSPKRVTR